MVEAGEFIPGRRRDHRRRRLGRRVGDHRRVRARHPRIGGDRSAVTGGTRVISDWIKVRITSDPGHTFLDRMIALVEGAERQKTPNEIALEHPAGRADADLPAGRRDAPAVRASTPAREIPIPVLIALLVCLIPTTIGALISAIGIAGMDRLVQHNVLAMSGRAVEAAGDVDTLLLDKTGTITLGNRQATEFVPVAGRDRGRAGRRRAAGVARRRDARRPVDRRAGKEKYGIRGRELAASGGDVRAVHGADADVWRQARRPRNPQGRRRCDRRATSTATAARVSPELQADRRADRPSRRHAAGGRRATPRARRRCT